MPFMITLINHASKTSTYRSITTENFLDSLHSEEMKYHASTYRKDYIVNRARGYMSRELDAFSSRNLPKVCFAAEWKKKQKQLVMKAFNGMTQLEVNNLQSADDAIELRRAAAQIPYTYLAFVGLSGLSVKIVCRYDCEDGLESKTTEQLERCHLNAYKRLHYIYSSQLGLSIDNIEPTIDQACMLSYDEEAYHNPTSEVLYVREIDDEIPVFKGDSEEKNKELKFAKSDISVLGIIYEWCMKDAVETTRIKGCPDDMFDEAVLSRLADYCSESNLPQDYAVMHTTWKLRFDKFDMNHIQTVFDNAYEKKLSAGIPYTHIDKSALMAYKTEAYLRLHYDLRRNVMTNVVMYRRKNGFDYDYHVLTDAVMNTISHEAIKCGIGSWDKDVHRLINSDSIPAYDPIPQYLFSLPQWDGKDRVKELIKRLPTTCPDAELYLHTWLLSMVAHWLGKDNLHGNALVPILIGDQGCGKTTFCSMLLPPALREYYNDKVEFKNETSLTLGLSSFALLNIDEFDALKPSQQPVLKYILSKSDIKLRLPYGRYFEQRRRYASFIATTNNDHPLVDRTGSRRFACIEVTHGKRIDYSTPIDYPQLYAQLMEEVDRGMQFWLDERQTARLMEHNHKYMRQATLRNKLEALFDKPKDDKDSIFVNTDAVIEIILQNYPDTPQSQLSKKDIGTYFNSQGFECKRTNKGAIYKIQKIQS